MIGKTGGYPICFSTAEADQCWGFTELMMLSLCSAECAGVGLVGGRYNKPVTGSTLQKAGSNISWRTRVCNINEGLGMFSFTHLNIVSIQAEVTVLISCKGDFSFFAQDNPCKNLHTSAVSRDRCKPMYFLVDESFSTLQTPLSYTYL